MQYQADEDVQEVSEAVEKKHFINEDKYQLLKQHQNDVFKEVEVSLSVRKMVNELITEENLQKVKSRFIAVLSK